MKPFAPGGSGPGGNLAALDCGSLSTRLLVQAPSGTTLARLSTITGLGEGVDGSGALLPDAVGRVLAVVRSYREVMDDLDVSAAAMIGTSALRDARNRGAFSAAAASVAGVPLELLTGEEEAGLSFDGATAALAAEPAPWLVADIGGGSTELAVGPAGPAPGSSVLGRAGVPSELRAPSSAVSLDMGCVRVTERFFAHDPPAAKELEAAREWLIGELSLASREVPALAEASTLVGLAGTVLALARSDKGISSAGSHAVHHHRLSLDFVEGALERFAGQTCTERAGIPGIDPGRARYMVGGTLVLASLMAALGYNECLVSEADILDGLIRRLARARQAEVGGG